MTGGAAAPRLQASGFEATRATRRLRTWVTSSESNNSLLSTGGDRLRQRATDSRRNNPYARSARDSFRAHMAGTGIIPSILMRDIDPGLKSAWKQLWLDWVDEADAAGITDLYGQQAIAAGGLFDNGESFCRLRARRPEDGLVVPLQTQLIPPVMLPLELNRTEPNGDQTRCGIRFNGIGKRVSYFFLRNHPGDFTRQVVGGSEYTEVPAEDICHVYFPEEEDQIRGVPWSSSSLVRLFLLDQFDDHTLAKMATTALFGIVRTRPAELEDTGEAEEEAIEDGTALRLAPGFVYEAPAGEDIKVVDPGEVGASYEPFEYRNLTAASAGMGVPYSNVTGDNSKNNYSSDRSAKVEFKRRVEQLQWACMIFQLCRPIRQRWTDDAVTSGALPIGVREYRRRRREFQRTRWITPRWDWVDPLKDLQAEVLAVEQGFKSVDDVIEGMGFDAEENDERILVAQKRREQMGIKLPASQPKPAPQNAERVAAPIRDEEAA